MRIVIWLASAACFALGLYVGLRVHAPAGAGLWGVSAILALVPFASHRNF